MEDATTRTRCEPVGLGLLEDAPKGLREARTPLAQGGGEERLAARAQLGNPRDAAEGLLTYPCLHLAPHRQRNAAQGSLHQHAGPRHLPPRRERRAGAPTHPPPHRHRRAPSPFGHAVLVLGARGHPLGEGDRLAAPAQQVGSALRDEHQPLPLDGETAPHAQRTARRVLLAAKCPRGLAKHARLEALGTQRAPAACERRV